MRASILAKPVCIEGASNTLSKKCKAMKSAKIIFLISPLRMKNIALLNSSLETTVFLRI